MGERKAQPIDAEVRDVLDGAFDKYIEGEKKHGVLDIDSDPRNFLKEAINELRDSIIYSALEIMRLEKLDDALNGLADDLETGTLVKCPTYMEGAEVPGEETK